MAFHPVPHLLIGASNALHAFAFHAFRFFHLPKLRHRSPCVLTSIILFSLSFSVLEPFEAGFVYDEYKMDDYTPQYIVIDQDMTIIYKNSTPSGKSPAEQQVLSLLE